jgi:hypothetical protein
MPEIDLTSVLEECDRAACEELLFFNPQQGRIRGPIVNALTRFGAPELVVDGGRVQIRTTRHPQLQTLYAFARDDRGPERLVGVAVYLRDGAERIAIVHLAVHEEFSATGRWRDSMLVMRLVGAIRRLAAQVKGVETVTLSYARGHVASLKPDRRSERS